ncbi:DUF2844 domain-containing protein [Paraburkholderia megapolitana]|nr:DUF2844 domain-containing protein [Paraburkholderia megapolitana]QDQ86130.1 DUF2844 domain-containing protein [Paraburkholderia megapolitana]
MSSPLRRAVIVTTLGSSLVLSAVPAAQAALGGSPMTPPDGSTVTTRVMHATSSAASASTASSTAAAAYSVRETTLASGTVVREYLSQAGTVFGIAWNGPQMPDLNSLLGTYFPQYVDGLTAVRTARGGHGPASVQSDNLVVQSGGHMGAFAGNAWLPQALPAGVSSSDIQ